MMKKFALMIFFTLFILTAVCGCGSKDNSAIIGKWTPSMMCINGQDVPYSELDVDNNKFYFDFKSDGKCTAMLAGIESVGTYNFNDTSVDIVTESDEYKLNFDNGTLTLVLTYDNDTTSFTFIKASEKE